MGRLNAAWDDFTKRGQAWDHFWQDAVVAGGGANTFTAPVSGGITTSGAADVCKVKNAPAAGGIISAGAATLAKLKANVASGGVQAGGGAALVKFKVPPAAGGLQTGGAVTAGELDVQAYLGTGGVSSGGGALVSKTKAVTSSGGVAAAGAAGLLKIKEVLGSGALVSDGIAPVLKIKLPNAGGLAVFGGAAVTAFQAPGGATTTAYTGTGGVFLEGFGRSEFKSGQVNAGGGGSARYQFGYKAPKDKVYSAIGSGRLKLAGAGRYSFTSAIVATPKPVAPVVPKVARVSPVAAPAPVPAPIARRAAQYAFVGAGGLAVSGLAKVAHVAGAPDPVHAAYEGSGAAKVSGSAASAFIAAAVIEHTAVVRAVKSVLQLQIGGSASTEFDEALLGLQEDELMLILEMME